MGVLFNPPLGGSIWGLVDAFSVVFLARKTLNKDLS